VTQPSAQALDAFAEWMRRVEQKLQALDAQDREIIGAVRSVDASLASDNVSIARLRDRIEALEAMHIMEPTPAPEPMLSKHWRVDADGSIDASVQLRRDVGKLVRAARELSRFVKAREFEGTKLAQKVADVDAATELFAGDFE
jgi:hypothetical protein